MYGMVNRAIKDLVLAVADEGTWQEVCGRAGMDASDFIDTKVYDDSVTYDLVGAASETLGVPTDEILQAFGRHWILFTGKEGWGSLFDMAGTDLVSFVAGLDSLHGRVQASMPECHMPSFVSTEMADGSLEVEYHSERPGLGPMVTGLLLGLTEYFDEPWQVTACGPIEAGGPELFRLVPGVVTSPEGERFAEV